MQKRCSPSQHGIVRRSGTRRSSPRAFGGEGSARRGGSTSVEWQPQRQSPCWQSRWQSNRQFRQMVRASGTPRSTSSTTDLTPRAPGRVGRVVCGGTHTCSSPCERCGPCPLDGRSSRTSTHRQPCAGHRGGHSHCTYGVRSRPSPLVCSWCRIARGRALSPVPRQVMGAPRTIRRSCVSVRRRWHQPTRRDLCSGATRGTTPSSR